jgi:hypothetical protein
MKQLGGLVLLFYVSVAIFVVVVLGSIMRLSGFSLFKLLRYMREELTIVLGTAAGDSVLPQTMRKLERLGIKDSTVGLVIPTGYSFNLDAFSIYLTLATVFIAQATNTPLATGRFAGDSRRGAADLEGRPRRSRLGHRRAGRDAGGNTGNSRHWPRPDPFHRLVRRYSAGARQLHRQLRRHRRDCLLGRRHRPRAGASRAQWRDRSRRCGGGRAGAVGRRFVEGGRGALVVRCG